MIYSRWRPDTGGYDYWDVPDERRGIGDDLPVPRLVQKSPIGVASTSAGRPLPTGGRQAGSGQLAKGSITPLDRTGLSGGDDAATMLPKLAAVAVVGVVLFWIYQASEDSLSLKRMFR